MWKYGRILQFLVANATILVAMYSVDSDATLTKGWEATSHAEYPHSTLNGTATYSSHSGTA